MNLLEENDILIYQGANFSKDIDIPLEIDIENAVVKAECREYPGGPLLGIMAGEIFEEVRVARVSMSALSTSTMKSSGHWEARIVKGFDIYELSRGVVHLMKAIAIAANTWDGLGDLTWDDLGDVTWETI